MKTKILLGTILALALSSLHVASGQEAESSFKLYMESLANGKKDTLELGVSPNGLDGSDCDYDSLLCGPSYYPFADTNQHIGAFAIQDLYTWFYQLCPNPVFVKRWIARTPDYPGTMNSMIVPLSALPVRIHWDSTLFQSSPMEIPALTDWNYGGYPDAGIGTVKADMSECSEVCLMTISQYLAFIDSIGPRNIPDQYRYVSEGDGDTSDLYIQIPDSMGSEHVYRYFSIVYNYRSDNEEQSLAQAVRIQPNPASEFFSWHSEIPIASWTIHDISGKTILQGSGNQTRIDCQNWPAGLYIFEWLSNTGQSEKNKFIKQ